MMTLDYLDPATLVSATGQLSGLGMDADELAELTDSDQQAIIGTLSDYELAGLGAAAKKPAKKKPGNPAAKAQAEQLKARLAKRVEANKALRAQLKEQKAATAAQAQAAGQATAAATAAQQQADRARAQVQRKQATIQTVRGKLKDQRTQTRTHRQAATSAQQAANTAQRQLATRTQVNQKLRQRNQAMRTAIAGAIDTAGSPPPAFEPMPAYELPYNQPGDYPELDYGYSDEPSYGYDDQASPSYDDVSYDAPAAPEIVYEQPADDPTAGMVFDAGQGAPAQEWGGDWFGDDAGYDQGDGYNQGDDYDDSYYYPDGSDEQLGSWLSSIFKKVTGTKLSNVVAPIAGAVGTVAGGPAGGIIGSVVGQAASGSAVANSQAPLATPTPSPAPAAPKPAKKRAPAFWMSAAALGGIALMLMQKGGRR